MWKGWWCCKKLEVQQTLDLRSSHEPSRYTHPGILGLHIKLHICIYIYNTCIYSTFVDVFVYVHVNVMQDVHQQPYHASQPGLQPKMGLYSHRVEQVQP